MKNIPHRRRHVRLPHRTTILLEQPFWSAIERVAKTAGMTWRQWVEQVLAKRPEGAGAASWLRVQCLRACLRHKRPEDTKA